MSSLDGVPVSQATVQMDSVPPDKSRKHRLASAAESDISVGTLDEDGGPAFQEMLSKQQKRQRMVQQGTQNQGRQNANQIETERTNATHVNVYLEAVDKRRLQAILVAKQLHREQIKVDRIFTKGKSQLQIRFATKNEAQSFINNTHLLQALKCTAKMSRSEPENSKGVIRGVDKEITEEEMIEEFSKATHYSIVSVKRITRQNENNQTEQTHSVILEFKGHVLPRSVGIYGLSLKVDVYVTKPRLCYRCQIYGHIAVQCQSRNPTCGFCAEAHDTRECLKSKETNTVPKCVNCQGSHNPNSTECPVMRHKYEARLQNTLHRTKFQALPTLRSTQEFPTLPSVSHVNEASDGQATLPSDQPDQESVPPAPFTLPLRQQKAQVKKFSQALTNRFCNDAQKYELRMKRYQHIVQRLENRSNTPNRTPAQRQQPTVSYQRSHYQRDLPQDQHNQTENPPQSEDTAENMIGQLLHSKSALTMLMMLMQMIIKASNSQDNLLDPANVREMQKHLLGIWDTPAQILTSPLPNMEVEEQSELVQYAAH
jgi:hypothetical protein